MSSLILSDFPGYLIDFNEYEEVQPLERSGQVVNVLFKHIKTGKYVYVRFPNIEGSFDVVSAQRRFLNEVWIQIRIRHPAIQFFRGFSLLRDNVEHSQGLFFDFTGSFTLQDVIDLEFAKHPPQEWTPTKKSIVIFGLAAVLKYVHSMGLIHRNVRTTKILLNENFEPLLSDFYSAILCPADGCTDFSTGAPIWRAPEVARQEPYGPPSDVFQFGQVVKAILTLKAPFPSKISNADLDASLVMWNDDDEIEFPKGLPDEYSGIYYAATCSNPANRASMNSIVKVLAEHEGAVWPGTDMKEYNAYKNKLLEFNPIEEDEEE